MNNRKTRTGNRGWVQVTLAGALIALSLPLSAEENPISNHTRGLYAGVGKIVVTTAEQMPEDKYGFKPVETVRSFGQIIGHITDSQYFFCASVLGEKSPQPQAEKTLSSKKELVAALKDAVAYCSRAYEGMTDKSGIENVKVMGSESPKLGALHVNAVHTIEHYGNLVTYMRINGLVPPTSDPAFMKTLMD